jgi:flagellar biosynthetic protein FliS
MVVLLYSEALTMLRRARTSPDAADRSVHTVLAILAELSSTLASREEQEAVVDLLSLYRYMSHRLTGAGQRVPAEALAEVEHLFVTLFDGWIQVLQGESLAGFPDCLEADDSRVTPTTLLSP